MAFIAAGVALPWTLRPTLEPSFCDDTFVVWRKGKAWRKVRRYLRRGQVRPMRTVAEER